MREPLMFTRHLLDVQPQLSKALNPIPQNVTVGVAGEVSEDDAPVHRSLLIVRRTLVELPTGWALRLHPGLVQSVGESGRETGSPS